MRHARTKRLSISLAVMLAANPVLAEANHAGALLPPPPAAPLTLWNFLGIPQGFNKIRDVTTNRRGNHPGMERLPPPRALADYRNLESPNPAIKKAAEIKAEEDLAPQKIKALKYLATVGCGCYPGVKEAFMAAMDDCTEEVRYQAMLSVIDAASSQCEVCDRNCCCDQDLTLKLATIAYEKNDECCWLEPSQRVRDAAKEAMCICCPNTGPYTPPTQEQLPPPPVRETPLEEGDEREVPMAHMPRLPAGSIQARSETDSTVDVIALTFDPPKNGQRPSQPVKRPAAAHTAAHRARKAVPQQAPGAPQAIAQDEYQPAAPARPERSRNLSAGSDLTIITDSLATEAEQIEEATQVIIQRPQTTPSTAKPSSRRQAAKRGVAVPDAVANAEPQAAPLRRAKTPENEQASFVATDEIETERSVDRTIESLPPVKRERMASEASYQTTNASTSASAIGEGTIARVNLEAGTVQLKFSRGSEVGPGTMLDVHHHYLLRQQKVGQLEVVAIGSSMVTAKPVGDLELDRISRGDVVVAAGAKPTNAKPAAVKPATVKSTASKTVTANNGPTKSATSKPAKAKAAVKNPTEKPAKAPARGLALLISDELPLRR